MKINNFLINTKLQTNKMENQHLKNYVNEIYFRKTLQNASGKFENLENAIE
jgi:hypothetical protein